MQSINPYLAILHKEEIKRQENICHAERKKVKENNMGDNKPKENWTQDEFWKKYKRSGIYCYWKRKSYINGTTYYTRTYFWQTPAPRSTYGEGFDDGRRCYYQIDKILKSIEDLKSLINKK